MSVIRLACGQTWVSADGRKERNIVKQWPGPSGWVFQFTTTAQGTLAVQTEARFRDWIKGHKAVWKEAEDAPAIHQVRLSRTEFANMFGPPPLTPPPSP